MNDVVRKSSRGRGYPGEVIQEVVRTAVEKSEGHKKSDEQLAYREKVLRLAREKAVPLDPEALKTDLFESDEELEEFIEDIYRYRRAFKA